MIGTKYRQSRAFPRAYALDAALGKDKEKERWIVKKRILPVLLALCLALGLAAPALAAETASTIKLSKTSGTVSVSKSSEKPLTLMSNMRLYNGYHVATKAGSYAWMNLDDTKLIKEDASSEVEVRKDGKKLEVNILSGNVFFDVSEKLEDDESLNISTSTMIVGIRGTAGYVRIMDRRTTLLTVLEGTVQCSVTDPVTGQLKSEPVRAGETATCVVYSEDHTGDRCDILRDQWTVDDIPGFVLADLVRDMDLCGRIEDGAGVDIPRELAKAAGGDPSGREPDRESATPEVLGVADRRQTTDEADLARRQDAVDSAVKGQDGGGSSDKVFSQKPGQPASGGTSSSGGNTSGGSGGSSGGSGSSGGNPSNPTEITVTMPQTWQQIQALLNKYNRVTVRPSGNAANDTLTIDGGLTVPAEKTLTLQSGVDAVVDAGGSLQVDGTMDGQNLTNNGTTTVTSGNSLRLSGNLSSGGTLTVTATGRIVVDAVFTRTGGTLALTEGAQVLAKSFARGAAPSDWEVSAEADDSGYYSLIKSAPVTPPPVKTYTVTYNGNNGTWDGSQTKEITVAEGSTLIEPDAPTLADHVCTSWNTQADGKGTRWVFGQTQITQNITLYAQWEEGYTVTFNSNGGSDVEPRVVVKGDTVYLPEPIRDGYDFAGWYTQVNGQGDKWESEKTQVTEDITLYAKWDVAQYTITLIGNGGVWKSVTTTTQETEIKVDGFHGQTIEKLPDEPTWEHYKLTGWNTKADGSGTAFDIYKDQVTGNMTLYAQWEQNEFAITFDANGGIFAGGEGTTILYTDDKGMLVSFPDDPKPSDGTSEFAGWVDALTDGKAVTNDIPFTGNTTVYAQWKP